MRLFQGAAPGATLAENWAFMRENFHGHTPASVHAENCMNDYGRGRTSDDVERPARVPDYSGVSGKVSQLSPQEAFYRSQMRVAVDLGRIPPPDCGKRKPARWDPCKREFVCDE